MHFVSGLMTLIRDNDTDTTGTNVSTWKFDNLPCQGAGYFKIMLNHYRPTYWIKVKYGREKLKLEVRKSSLFGRSNTCIYGIHFNRIN
jgi:hypothetical protein